MFGLCVISGLMVGISLGWAYKVNNNQCPLNADLSLSMEVNKSVKIDPVSSQINIQCVNILIIY